MKAVILTQGKIAVVDDDDFERVSQFKWHAAKIPRKNRRTYWYARTSNMSKGGMGLVPMQNFILGIKTDRSLMVDHLDGDGTNNTRSNIRLATRSQNCCNTRKNSRAKISKFKGVSYNPRCIFRPWKAAITHLGKYLSIGQYKTEIEAAKAYDEHAIKFFGEFAHTNQMLYGEL